jgi:hypothetical protein
MKKKNKNNNNNNNNGTEKKLKYKSICIEVKRMRNMKCVIIPVIIGGTRIVTKGFKEEFGSHTMKPFNRFTTKGSYTRNITHNTGSTAD